MATINFILQGKGGVGKSFIASVLAQYYQENNRELACFDTDPVNTTFAGYEALNVNRVKILEDNKINPRVFDEFFNQLLELDEDGVAVVDNGASTFIPLCSYLIDNQIIPLMTECGHRIILHSILTGGQALPDTLNGLSALFSNFPDVPIIVWQNEYFGKLQFNGQSFENSKLFIENKKSIYGLMILEAQQPETFGYDLERMLQDRQTFTQARNNSSYNIFSRQRLTQIWRKIKQQLEPMNL